MSADLLADSPLDDTDAAVLRAVRELHSRTDPMPTDLTDRIKFELTLAALHAELAELQQLTLAGVRADDDRFAPTESVTFASSTMSIMVTIGPADEPAPPGTVRIDGWVTGPAAAVEVRIGTVSHTAQVDPTGRFVLDGVPHGSARFVLRPADPAERAVITPSVEI